MIMRVHIQDNSLVIIIEPKTFHFDLPKNFINSLKAEIDSLIKRNEFLAELTIKKEISQLLFKYKHSQLLFKYKHENDIHELKNQYNE